MATVSHSSLTFTPQNYATPQTVTVYGTQDEDSAEGTTTIPHTASGGGYDISTAQNVTVTVTDDDTPSLVMSTTELTVNEGGTGTYTVKLNTQPTGSVTVNITGAGGNSDEVTIDKSSLVFTTETWNSAQTVTVTGVEDDGDLTDDMATLNHSATGASEYSSVSATVTVTVNDNDTMTYSFDEREHTVNEGGTVMVTLSVNIAAGSDDNRRFGISVVTSGGATSPDPTAEPAVEGDYSGVPNEVTISGGATSQSFTVTIRDNDGDDDGEAIHIVVSSEPDGVSAGDITVVTINITDTHVTQQ